MLIHAADAPDINSCFPDDIRQGYLELRDAKPRDQRLFSPLIVGLPAMVR